MAERHRARARDQFYHRDIGLGDEIGHGCDVTTGVRANLRCPPESTSFGH
jgi:hypothetical protein